MGSFTLGSLSIPDFTENARNYLWTGKDMHRQMKATKKMMAYQSQLNQQNQLWTAKNMPTATVDGLRSAGLNPLLAYTDFSGLSSSGAMGVSPSTYSSGFAAADLAGGLGLSDSVDGYDKIFGSGKKGRKNKSMAEDVTTTQLETKSDIADYERELAPHTAKQKMLSDADNADAIRMEAQNRQKEAELKAYQLSRQYEAVTGKQAFRSATFGDQSASGSDAMNEFWTDYYRQKMDLDKWTNSAYRQYLLDGVDAFDKAGKAIGSMRNTKYVPYVPSVKR